MQSCTQPLGVRDNTGQICGRVDVQLRGSKDAELMGLDGVQLTGTEGATLLELSSMHNSKVQGM